MTSKCQTVWTKIRTDVLSGLNWVQTVCKGNQQLAEERNQYCIQYNKLTTVKPV